MNLKRTVAKLAFVSILLLTFIVFMGAAQPYRASKSAHVDEHWFTIIIDAESYMLALLEHDIDMGGVPLPEYLDDLYDADYTVTTTTRLGYTFTMENARRWPFGGWSTVDPVFGKVGDGTPTEAWATNAMNFRKGLHRLVDMDYIAGELYAPLMSECKYYLPPGAAYWISPTAPGPSFNPGVYTDVAPLTTSAAYLNLAGYLPADGNDGRPLAVNDYADADTGASWYCPYMRVDPSTGLVMDEFEYYAIGPVESPIGFEMATTITAAFHTAGVRCNLVAGTWLGMVIRLVNAVLEDYQMMTGVGIVWGSPAPDILYDFTYSTNLPLWNFCAMNYTVMDVAGTTMMSTLNLATCRQAAYWIQGNLSEMEPYRPMLLWEMFLASTGPYESEPGMIGIVNFKGRGPHTSGNVWGKQLSRAGRDHPTSAGVEINKWGLGAYLDTLNPLTADTVPDWQCLTGLFEGFYNRNPYTLEYMWAGAEDMPTIEEWVGPGSSYGYGGFDSCDAVYDNAYNGTHYAGIGANEVAETPQPDPYPCGGFTIVPGGDDVVIPVADVTDADCAGDDVPGMVTTWTITEGQWWHDSDFGDNGIPGDGDTGENMHYCTTADAEFGFNLLKYQTNTRYMTQWYYVAAVEVIDTYEFKVYEERRFLFAFEGHDVCMLSPKHIWEPFIGTGQIHDDALEVVMVDGSCSYADCWDYYTVDDSGYNNHHDFWEGWRESYIADPNKPGWTLTKLIGNGPFTYHIGGWVEGESVAFESWSGYPFGHVCPADIDFNQRVEPATEDVNKLLASIGSYGATNYHVECDTVHPAQIVDLSEISLFLEHSGDYWGRDPVPAGFDRCPTSTVE